MNPDPRTQRTPDATAPLLINQGNAQAPRHALFSQPLFGTAATIDAVLKKHYGTQFTEQDVRFARDLCDQLRAAFGITGGQPPALAETHGTFAGNADIDEAVASTLPPAMPHTHWTYCTPRDNDSPKFLIAFDDADRPPVLLTDEEDARTAFARYEQNWNCHLFELARRAPAEQGETGQRPFTWPPLSAGAQNAVAHMLSRGVTRAWGPSDIYEVIKSNTPTPKAPPIDPGSWTLMAGGPRSALEQARCTLTGPVADGAGRRAAIAAIDAVLDMPAAAFGVPGEWLREVIAYLEDSVEKIGPDESYGSIDARKLLYRAPPAGADRESQAVFVAHAMIRWLDENQAAMEATQHRAIDEALHRLLGAPTWASKANASGELSTVPPPVDLTPVGRFLGKCDVEDR